MRILVTGATGSHGSTGHLVAYFLLKENAQVRAMARREDGRAQILRDIGCEVVIADFHDLASLRAAVRDVDACYFSYPIREGITIAAANVALAAKENGVRSIVKNTMAVTMDLSPSPFARQSFLAEQIFSWAGLTTVNLRSGFFFENLLRYSENEIIREGKIRWPLGSGETRMAWIAAPDVAIAACRMVRDQPKASETILLTGPDAFTFNEVADVCSTVLGKRVVYENSEDQDFFYRRS